jgi:prefoldin subunit 5
MDDVDSAHECVAETDAVELCKRFVTDTYRLPAVEYTFRSHRDQAVAVRTVEQIPEPIPAEDLGFVASDATDTWQIKGPMLVASVDLEPGEEYVTACAARGDDAAALQELLTAPETFEVDPGLDAPDSAEEPADPSPRVRIAPPDDHPESDRTTPDPAPSLPDEPEGVVEQFVAELQAGEVDEASTQYLAAAFGGEEPARSVDARLSQLQADVADMQAYTNALEAFIDDNGTGPELLDRVERRLETLEERVTALEGTAREREDEVTDLQTDVAALTGETDDLAAALDDVGDDVAALEDELASVENSLPDDDLEARIASIDEDLQAVQSVTDTLRTAFRS